MVASQRDEFVANPDSYHKYTAHVLAMLSGHVYKFKNKADLLEKAQEMHVRFDSVSTFGPKGNEVVILENQECAVVVWRGSATKRDWQDNFTLGCIPFEIQDVQGSIGKGFWNHTDKEWKRGASDGVSAKLLQLTCCTRRKVFFTGHSLGGACAWCPRAALSKSKKGWRKWHRSLPQDNQEQLMAELQLFFLHI